MIITKTPFECPSLAAEQIWKVFKNMVAVLSTTFDKYCYVNVRHLPRFLIIPRSYRIQDRHN